jgi:hypothetical protein
MRNQKLKDLREQHKASSRYPPTICLLLQRPSAMVDTGQRLISLLLTVLQFHTVLNVAQAYTCQQTLLCYHIVSLKCIFCYRIFLAGKKVMQIALGRSPADEAKTGLHKLSKVTSSVSGTHYEQCALISGSDQSIFAVFSSFKVTLVCSLPIFQGMMWRGSIVSPLPTFFSCTCFSLHWDWSWSYVILTGCFENLRSMILQGREVLPHRRYSIFFCFYSYVSLVSSNK